MKADLDIGNLIYIILTIIFLVAGALGKKKKPAPVRSQEVQDEPVSGIRIDDILRELSPVPVAASEPEYSFNPENTVEDGPSLDTIPGDPVIVDTVPAETAPVDNTAGYSDWAVSEIDKPVSREGISAFTGKTGDSDISGGGDEEMLEMAAGEVASDFDARRAFIYSEIFKPKYF